MKNIELRFEKWQHPILGGLGTIRTIPENYYAASVYDDQLTFEGIEASTKDIDENYVRKWAVVHIFNNL